MYFLSEFFNSGEAGLAFSQGNNISLNTLRGRRGHFITLELKMLINEALGFSK